MVDKARRTIPELLAIFQFEPALRHVFVEGRSDRTFIEWFMTESVRRGLSVPNCEVYEIGDVEVPNDAVIGAG